LGDSLKANLPGASAAKELFKAAVAMGHSKEDWSALIKVIEKLSGL
jgi:3-hydroxyisobutyrate dehydrogenase-like beta-hydroxyacid dehydrogenase